MRLTAVVPLSRCDVSGPGWPYGSGRKSYSGSHDGRDPASWVVEWRYCCWVRPCGADAPHEEES